MFTFLTQHQFWVAVVLYWIFSAAVSAMPEPGEKTAPEYLWLFRFLHSVAGNITTVFGNRMPGLKTLLPILMVPLLLTASGCAQMHYTIHPGALNSTDSIGYDTLLIAQSTIDSARADFQAGELPESAKPAFDTLVRAYNLAHQSWLTYRSAIATNQPVDTYFNQLNQNLTALGVALRVFAEVQ